MRRTGLYGTLASRFVVLIAVSTVTGCHTAEPPAPAASIHGAPGTVTGKIEASEGVMLAVAGRGVEAVNVQTGERQTVLTGRDGGFAMRLVPGTWRLELRLEPGETLAQSPRPVTIAPATLRHDVRFVVAPVLSQPHRPTIRLPRFLGAPIA
jgi:hypothetical protein